MIAIKTLFITGLLSVCFAFQGTAQLDSISVSHHIAQLPDPDDTMSTIDVVMLDITVYDMDFLGELIIVPYDTLYNHPIFMLKYTKQQLLDEGFLDVGVYDQITTIPLYGLDDDAEYRIDITARNFQGANLPLKEHFYE